MENNQRTREESPELFGLLANEKIIPWFVGIIAGEGKNEEFEDTLEFWTTHEAYAIEINALTNTIGEVGTTMGVATKVDVLEWTGGDDFETGKVGGLCKIKVTYLKEVTRNSVELMIKQLATILRVGRKDPK